MTRDDLSKIIHNPFLPAEARNGVKWMFEQIIDLRERVAKLESEKSG